MFQNNYASIVEMIDALKGCGIDTQRRNDGSRNAAMRDQQKISVGVSLSHGAPETGDGFSIGLAFGETHVQIEQTPALIDVRPDRPGGFVGAAFKVAAVHFAEISVANRSQTDGCADDLGSLPGAMKQAVANLCQALANEPTRRFLRLKAAFVGEITFVLASGQPTFDVDDTLAMPHQVDQSRAPYNFR